MNTEQFSFEQGIFVGAGGVLIFLCSLLLIRPWLKAILSGAPISLAAILGLRLRGNSPTLLADAYVTLVKMGVSVDIQEVEVVYITNKTKASTTDDLVKLVQKHPAIINKQKAQETSAS